MFLAAVYIGAGVAALYLLSHFTGVHYEYWDVVFIENDKLTFVSMDLNFITKHLGFALCTGALLAYLLESQCQSGRIGLIALMSPIVGELFIRFEVWRGFFYRWYYGETSKSVIPDGVMAMIGIGTSVSAALFTFFTLLIMFRRERYDTSKTTIEG